MCLALFAFASCIFVVSDMAQMASDVSEQAGSSGVAAVVALLQAENGFRSPVTSKEDKRKSESSHQVHAKVARESQIGDAVRAELELEDLQTKRRRLVELSKKVLEVRCTGFCAKVSISEEDYLREASYVLADISKDVDDAAHVLRSCSACSPELPRQQRQE